MFQTCAAIFSTSPGDLDFDTEWQKMIDDLNIIYNR